MRRTLNWNNRHCKSVSRGYVAPRDYTRRAPLLSNGRWIPVNTRTVEKNDG